MFYPGSYVDIAPSFVFGSVTYLDTDRRTPAFFGDTSGIREIIAEHNGPADADLAFIHADYTGELDLPHDHFDLPVSLYAGFISEHCTQHLRVGGKLLVNSSHGDAAMASIDPRYELTGVVISRDGSYKVGTSALDSYLVPKKPQPVTIDSLHASGNQVQAGATPPAAPWAALRPPSRSCHPPGCRRCSPVRSAIRPPGRCARRHGIRQ